MDQEAIAHLIVDNRDDGLFRVNRQAFTAPQILAWEQRRVFEQSWIYAGHTSEIPEPGDFRARKVAGRPIIVVRRRRWGSTRPPQYLHPSRRTSLSRSLGQREELSVFLSRLDLQQSGRVDRRAGGRRL